LSMNETATEAISAIQGNVETGKEIDLKDFAGKYTLGMLYFLHLIWKNILLLFVTSLDVIARCCFAARPDSHNNPNNKFIKSAAAIFNLNISRLMVFLLMPRMLVKLLGIEILPKEPMDYFKQAILHLIKERREKNIKVNDFLQLLIDAQEEGANGTETIEANVDIVKDNEAHHGNEDTEDAAKINAMFDKKLLKKKTLDENEMIANSILFLAAG